MSELILLGEPEASEHRSLSIAVFCGARTSGGTAVLLAERIGRLLGERGHRLVYGGGGSGLMGTVAWSAFKGGADILGVTPQDIREREAAIAAPPQDTHITETMSERKSIMMDAADAFIALPGGYGTVDEILDVISLSYLGMHRKPLCLLHADGEWNALRETLGMLVGLGYADPLPEDLFTVTEDATAAVAFCERQVRLLGSPS
jgi:cytokinin riboside 5'-monophosphate phosphoribohydrolase